MGGCASAVVEIPGGAVSSYNMNVAGETYKLMGDVTATSTAFVAGANNIILDGQGYTVTFASTATGYGVDAASRSGITIKDVRFVHDNAGISISHGLYFHPVTSSSVINCTVVNSNGYGIYSTTASGNIIDNCVFTILGSGNTHGIYLGSSSNNNTIKNSNISTVSGGHSVYITTTSINNTLRNNTASALTGTGMFINSNKNTINLCNASSDSGTGLAIVTSNNTNVSDSNGKSRTGYGIRIQVNSYNNTINRSVGTSIAGCGIGVSSSTGNNISYSEGISDTSPGIQLTYANQNYFDHDVGKSTSHHGLRIDQSNLINYFSSMILDSPRYGSAPYDSRMITMLGDSITALDLGSNVSRSLGNITPPYHVINRGVGGEQASNGVLRVDDELSLTSPDIVTIMYGTNDISHGVPQQTIIDNILQTANTVKEYGATPYIMTVTPRSANTQAIIDLDIALTDQAEAAGYNVIDTYDSLDSVPLNGLYDSYVDAYYFDGLHPNGAGNALLGEYVAGNIARAAYFSASSTSGNAPLAIQYTDSTTNYPLLWSWDFENDGITDSTQQNPVHTYGKAGNYSVNLTVRNEYGNFSKVKTNYITVAAQTPPTTLNQMMAILKHYFPFLFLTLQEAQ